MKYLALLALSLLLTTCQAPPDGNSSHFRGTAQGVPYHIEIPRSLTRNEKQEIRSILRSNFAKIDQIANPDNPLSEISLFNQSRSTAKFPLSPYLYQLLFMADQLVQLTEGRYDPTIAPIISLWKSALNREQLPSSQELVSSARYIGWDHLIFNNGFIQKNIPDLKLNLNAITKGMAVDTIIRELAAAGFEDTFVEWSGEIRAHGSARGEVPWSIEMTGSLRTPENKISLINQSLATSGNYIHYWVLPSQEGEVHVYSHLINKKELKPIELHKKSVISVTVTAPTCTLADGLATAAMLFEDPIELDHWIKTVKEEYPEVTFRISLRQIL